MQNRGAYPGLGSIVRGLLFLTAVCLYAAAEARVKCDDHLQPGVYEVSSHLNFKLGAPARAQFKPEFDSLEHRKPGLALAFMRIYEGLHDDSAYSARLIEQVFASLNHIDQAFSARENPTLKHITDFLREILHEEKSSGILTRPDANENQIHHRMRWVQANIWQAVVAVHLAAKEFRFNQRLEDLHPQQFELLHSESLRQVEIDIVAVRPNGQRLWVEVKDWGLRSTLRHRFLQNVASQCERMRAVRARLRQSNLQIMLMMKHGGVDLDTRRMYESLSCDRVRFMYPES